MKDFDASEYAKSELESILKDMHEKEDSTYDAYCTDYKLQAIQAWYLADIANSLNTMYKRGVGVIIVNPTNSTN